MNEFLDKLADLMEEYGMSIELCDNGYYEPPSMELFSNNFNIEIVQKYIEHEHIRVLKTKEDVTEK